MLRQKRILSMLVMAGMLVSVLPAAMAAESPRLPEEPAALTVSAPEGEKKIAGTAELTISFAEDQVDSTPEEREELYLDRLFYGEQEVSVLGMHDREDLPHMDAMRWELHDWLAPIVENWAANGGSTQIDVPENSSLLTLSDASVLSDVVFDATYTLYCEHPENFYWSSYGNCRISYSYYEGPPLQLASVKLMFPVDRYNSEDPSLTEEEQTYYLDNQKIQRAIRSRNNAVAEAKKIRQMTFDDPSGKDYGEPIIGKLRAAKNRICELTSYNWDSIQPDYTGPDDNQNLIDVFDNDPNTNVVCAGYATAYQYLCDHIFQNGELECYFATGNVMTKDGQGGAHAWNIVRLNGESYMVDVTHCDMDNYGDLVAHDDKFMCSPKDGSMRVVEAGKSYIFNESTYSYESRYDYDERTMRMYNPAILTLTEGTPAGAVTGTVTSSGDVQGTVTVQLFAANADTPAYTTTTTGGSYTMEGVEPGSYTLKVSKASHVTRSYAVTVGSGTVTQDVTICLLGDINGDNMVDMRDWTRLYDHISDYDYLNDDYALACANVNGDNTVDMRDWTRLYDHVSDYDPLW